MRGGNFTREVLELKSNSIETELALIKNSVFLWVEISMSTKFSNRNLILI